MREIIYHPERLPSSPTDRPLDTVVADRHIIRQCAVCWPAHSRPAQNHRQIHPIPTPRAKSPGCPNALTQPIRGRDDPIINRIRDQTGRIVRQRGRVDHGRLPISFDGKRMRDRAVVGVVVGGSGRVV